MAELLDDEEITDLSDQYRDLVSKQLRPEEEEADEPVDLNREVEEEENPVITIAKSAFLAMQQRSEALKKFLAAVENKSKP